MIYIVDVWSMLELSDWLTVLPVGQIYFDLTAQEFHDA